MAKEIYRALELKARRFFSPYRYVENSAPKEEAVKQNDKAKKKHKNRDAVNAVHHPEIEILLSFFKQGSRVEVV